MTEITHVIPGPGKTFHGISEAKTRIYRQIDPALPTMVLQHWGDFDPEGKKAHERLWELLEKAGAFEPTLSLGQRSADPHYIFMMFCHLHNRGGQDSWLSAYNRQNVVPLCGMVKPAQPVPIEEAEARGMTWSKECAKKLGLIQDERPPLVRVSWKGSRRAYMHVLDCEVCQRQGVQHCKVFPLLAEEKIDSDVDPRLDELLS